uniref:Uncharacterized protein n=1 Tax=Avena sativa TaxID=4498 RepID=A0ACD5TDR5_AVESA
MKKGSVVGVVILLFMACLLVGGQCRPETRRSYQDGRANTTTVELLSNESKIKLIMCLPRACKTKGEPVLTDCICCLTRPGVPCFHSTGKCQENCPPLKPK